MVDYKIFHLGDFLLQSGLTIGDAKLAYQTYGTLNKAKDNVILYMTHYAGQHYDNEWLIAEDMPLDPRKWFVISPNLFGNGLSSSPSNQPIPQDRARFPATTMYDNVRAQHRLVTEEFGISRITLVCGWSMGAGQSFQWPAQYPDMVERALPWLGSAKCSIHNIVYLDALRAAIEADSTFNGGFYTEPPLRGLQAHARVHGCVSVSPTFYRNEEYKRLGYSSARDYLVRFWELRFRSRDANDLLHMLDTWQTADISNNELYSGDLQAALKGIKASVLILANKEDYYFPQKDNELELPYIKNGSWRLNPSMYGHFSGGGFEKHDADFICQAIYDILDTEPFTKPNERAKL